MKTFQEYIQESLNIVPVMESFASKTLAELFNIDKSYSRHLLGDRWGSAYQLQWDKVTDDMLEEITPDEAYKRQRKQKESHYILWVGEDWKSNKRMIYCITWGYDCIAAGFRRKGNETTKSIIDSHVCVTAYDIKGDYTKLMRGDIQRQRREAKVGATALMDAYSILRQNSERYETAINKMRTAGVEDVTKWLDEGMTAYANAVEKYVGKMKESLMVDCISTWDIRRIYEKLNSAFNSMIHEVEKYKSFTDPKRSYIHKDTIGSSIGREAADNIKKLSAQLVELCTQLQANINTL